MAKGIVVELAGTTSSFAMVKLERSKLYGSRRRIAVDADGNQCMRASLTDDGEVLIRSGMTAQGYFDTEGRQVEPSELNAIDDQGRAIPLLPSTLGVPQPLVGPVPATELLDLAVSAVYGLLPEELGEPLASALGRGECFRAPFNYRPDYRSEFVYLIQNDSGIFALVGVAAPALWMEQKTASTVEDADEDGELDFDMF